MFPKDTLHHVVKIASSLVEGVIVVGTHLARRGGGWTDTNNKIGEITKVYLSDLIFIINGGISSPTSDYLRWAIASDSGWLIDRRGAHNHFLVVKRPVQPAFQPHPAQKEKCLEVKLEDSVQAFAPGHPTPYFNGPKNSNGSSARVNGWRLKRVISSSERDRLCKTESNVFQVHVRELCRNFCPLVVAMPRPSSLYECVVYSISLSQNFFC